MYFDSLFSSAGKKEVEYKGEKIYSGYDYCKLGLHKLKFTFISSNPKREQCIVLLGNNDICEIEYNGKKYHFPKGRFPSCDIFEKDFGKSFILNINLKKDHIAICNGAILEVGDTQLVRYSSFGCAMKIEEISDNKIRFYCNDYEPNDDFNDLIFEIEFLD